MHFSKIFFTLIFGISCISCLEARKTSDISTINDYSHESIAKSSKKINKNKKMINKKVNSKRLSKKFNRVNTTKNQVSEVDHTEEMIEENGTSI